MAGAKSEKSRSKRKVWYEIYWPDSTNSHANNTKTGRMHNRRVADKYSGKKIYSMLLELQEEFEKTGVEHPMLQGYGPYVAEMKRRPKQHSA